MQMLKDFISGEPLDRLNQRYDSAPSTAFSSRYQQTATFRLQRSTTQLERDSDVLINLGFIPYMGTMSYTPDVAGTVLKWNVKWRGTPSMLELWPWPRLRLALDVTVIFE
jgi:hypothetical protein